MQKLKSRVEVWKTRELTWEGKCYLIRSFGMAQMADAMEMNTIPETCISEINKIFDDFLWKKMQTKYKKRYLRFAKTFGRLRIIRCVNYGQSQENHVDYTIFELRAR